MRRITSADGKIIEGWMEFLLHTPTQGQMAPRIEQIGRDFKFFVVKKGGDLWKGFVRVEKGDC